MMLIRQVVVQQLLHWLVVVQHLIVVVVVVVEIDPQWLFYVHFDPMHVAGAVVDAIQVDCFSWYNFVAVFEDVLLSPQLLFVDVSIHLCSWIQHWISS